MGKVLTSDLTLKCAPDVEGGLHGGTLAKSGSARLRIDGQQVLTGANIKAGLIAGCADTNSGQTPCSAVTKVVPGQATKLKVDGELVVIDSLGGVTNGTPRGKIAAGPGVHDRLRSA